MKTFIILSLTFIFTGGVPVSEQNNQSVCHDILIKSGASDSFDAMVAHGVHSLTLDDLKQFDPLATENNFVPTIDRDLRSEIAILPYTPDWKSTDSSMFLTEPMKVLDSVLSHMHEKHWDIVAFNPLERVVHAFHMKEAWARTKKEFDQIGKTRTVPSDQACSCAMDVENNGIMKVMRFTAMALREPGLVYGHPAFANKSLIGNASPQYYVQAGYTYRFFKHEEKQKNSDAPLDKMLVQDLTDAMPPLKDAAAWNIWKGKADPPMEHQRDLAMFLYCAIKKAHQTK